MSYASTSLIVRAIQEQAYLTVAEEDLHKLTPKPIKHMLSSFEAYAAQAGEFGVRVYCYENGDITVHVI